MSVILLEDGEWWDRMCALADEAGHPITYGRSAWEHDPMTHGRGGVNVGLLVFFEGGSQPSSDTKFARDASDIPATLEELHGLMERAIAYRLENWEAIEKSGED